MTRQPSEPNRTRRDFLRGTTAAALGVTASALPGPAGAEPPAAHDREGADAGAEAAGGTTILDFEKKLAEMRLEHYRHPPVDIIKTGFRPVGGMLADFCDIEHQGRYHFFYIERRLTEGTPFYPGHETYFGHASTADFFAWEVHEPVMLIRPGTWEGAHVWAPFILRHGDEFLMAYTGVNRHLSQDIGLASSRDLFDWRRWESNPLSPCKGKDWAAWWPDRISSCRDPHLLRHAGRIYLVFTANTRQGAACLAMASTTDLVDWQDHGPILVGPASGYEPRLRGGHPQGSLESSNLSLRDGRWTLIFHAAIRGKGRGNWILQSDRMDRFELSAIRPFWPDGGLLIEVVQDHGSRSLLAGVSGGYLRFGEVDWASRQPTARFVSREELQRWRDLAT